MNKLLFLFTLTGTLIWGCSHPAQDPHDHEAEKAQTAKTEPHDHLHDTIYKITKVVKEPFRKIIHTSGQILPALR
jgi:hypothetical protein